MARDQSDLESLYARLSLEEEDEGGIVIGQSEIQGHKETFVLAGNS